MREIGPVVVGPFSYSVSMDNVIAVYCFELCPEIQSSDHAEFCVRFESRRVGKKTSWLLYTS